MSSNICPNSRANLGNAMGAHRKYSTKAVYLDLVGELQVPLNDFYHLGFDYPESYLNMLVISLLKRLALSVTQTSQFNGGH